MPVKKHISIWLFAAVIALLLCSVCAADEIIFKNQGAKQIGTVVEENEQGITIMFPKEAVKSINRGKGAGPIPSSNRIILEDNGGAYVTVKIPRQRFEAGSFDAQAAEQPAAQKPAPAAVTAPASTPTPADSQLSEKVDRLEKKMASMEKSGPPPAKGSTRETLFQEEMGSVEGVILWNGKPLQNAKVKIVMETYTGFSIAAVKQAFESGDNKSATANVGISLDAQTDSAGHYYFPKVPPGSYTLFWQPDLQTGWVRRIRENPDLEVMPGKLMVLNIPEKKKQK